MRRLVLSLGALVLITGFLATPSASAQQSVNLYVGAFTPRSADARDGNDVLLNDLDFLRFRIRDFDGATVGGEWLFGMSDHFEGGLGIGFYSRTARSVDRDFSNPDNSPIAQDLKLRIVPFTATVRFLPLGHHDAITPYIGGGVGVLGWRYTESGQFVNGDDTTKTTRGTFSGSGSATGPVVLGGIRVPVGSLAFGGELRYQWATDKLPTDQGFAGSKIDLGGMNYLFTVNVRF